MNCPVCHEPYLAKETRGPTGGFKGAKYTSEYYEHEDKECVYQSAYYPNYFGKGPKTVYHSWSTAKEKKPKEQVRFIILPEGRVQLSRQVSNEIFRKLLKAGAVTPPKPGFPGWNFDRVKSKPILEQEYEVI
jgi:hypothetical protein